MTDIVGSQRAAAQYNGKAIAFSQGADLCDALVSRWIRKRFRNKDFFNPRYFKDWTVPDNAKSFLLGYKSWAPGPDPKKTKLGAAPGGSRVIGMQKAFIGKPDVSNSYIQQGKPSQPNKGNENDLKMYPTAARIADKVETKDLDHISKDFQDIDRRRLMVSFSFRTFNTSHACALDARSANDVRYFDPNIGEFRFNNFKDFVGWWTHCAKTKGASAKKEGFDIFNGLFAYTTFTNP